MLEISVILLTIKSGILSNIVQMKKEVTYIVVNGNHITYCG